MKNEVCTSTVYLMDTDVYYEFFPCKGKGQLKKTMILIHGFVSSCFSFRKLIPELRKEFDIYTLDLPGFGKSGKRKNFVYSFHNYASVVIAFCQLFKLDEVILVGHSMGGQVALYTAKVKPNLVEKIVLLSSSGYLKKVKKPYVYASFLPFAKQAMKWWIQKKDYKESLLQVVYDKKMIDDETLTEYTRPFSENEFYDALLCLLRQREGDLTKDELHRISHSVQIVWGEEDSVIPVRIGRQLARDLPNATFTSFAKTGHLLPEERPKEVAKLMKDFLQ
ncbi:alpha/beta fold hydrolase [Bacillus suaedae]|uniref:Alpha/beta hydrolase n=1 Tax=Halalkalibacter suaedae TaxID=2822140 RepID=A0A940WV99_9BACI|nr:alpha/beta hydrolase [Bacillus suaedae]MBP3952921.1 alpha/beta hydrolase [Bacillus suaedae]